MYTLFLSQIVVTLIIFGGVSCHVDSRYDAQCTISSKDGALPDADGGSGIPCVVALFSHFNFNYQGSFVYNRTLTLCTDTLPELTKNSGSVIAVNRGSCSFDEKASNAILLGYDALLVVDTTTITTTVTSSDGKTSDINTPFPMGSTNTDFQSTIPILMININSLNSDSNISKLICDDLHTNDITTCDLSDNHNHNNNNSINISLYYNKATNEGVSKLSIVNIWKTFIRNLPYYCGMLILVLVTSFYIFTFTVTGTGTGTSNSNDKKNNRGKGKGKCVSTSASASYAPYFPYFRLIIPYSIIIIFAICLRLGTYRLLKADGFSVYHHNETDEKIFEYLINKISDVDGGVVGAAATSSSAAATATATATAEFGNNNGIGNGIGIVINMFHNVFQRIVHKIINIGIKYGKINLNFLQSYNMSDEIIKRLNLSPNNYNNNLFIHPPLFVIISALLKNIFDISLPTIPIIFHLCVLLLLPVLIAYSGFDVQDMLKYHKPHILSLSSSSKSKFSQGLSISVPPPLNTNMSSAVSSGSSAPSSPIPTKSISISTPGAGALNTPSRERNTFFRSINNNNNNNNIYDGDINNSNNSNNNNNNSSNDAHTHTHTHTQNNKDTLLSISTDENDIDIDIDIDNDNANANSDDNDNNNDINIDKSVIPYYRDSVGSMSLWAGVIFIFDPLSHFCSQKFWIDNCLLFTTTLSASIHLYIWQRNSNTNNSTTITTTTTTTNTTSTTIPPSDNGKKYKRLLIFKGLISGIIFGCLVLYSKITGLAMLPFMILHIISTMIETLSIIDIILYCIIPYVIGTFCSYLPWMVFYYNNTGLYIPNAWPNIIMINKSNFLKIALKHTKYYYFIKLLEFSPITIFCYFVTIFNIIRFFLKILWQYLHSTSRSSRINGNNYVLYGCSSHVLVWMSWPCSFLIAFTLIGMSGGGYQTRFILPIIPATCVLAARFIHTCTSSSSLSSSSSSSSTTTITSNSSVNITESSAANTNSNNNSGNDTSKAGVYIIVTISLAYSAIHCFYYGVMFSNLYADLDISLLLLLKKLLIAPYHPMTSKSAMDDMLKFIAHFGIHLNSS
jgi:hypothetical protein